MTTTVLPYVFGDFLHIEIFNVAIAESTLDSITIPIKDITYVVPVHAIGYTLHGLTLIGKNSANNKPVEIEVISRSLEDADSFVAKKSKVMEASRGNKNVSQLFQCMKDLANYYFVKDVSPNGDTFSTIARHLSVGIYVPNDAAKKIVLQVCDGLKHCHSNRVAHRNVTLDNIMFHGEDAKLDGFDFACITGKNRLLPDTEPGNVGTPEYKAPEVWRYSGTSYNLHAADCWSLGVLIFSMLTRYYPFGKDPEQSDFFHSIEDAGATSHSIEDAGATSHSIVWPDILENVYPGSQEVLEGLLCVNPSERWTLNEVIESPWLYDGIASGLESGQLTRSSLSPPTTFVSNVPVFTKEEIRFSTKKIPSSPNSFSDVVTENGPEYEDDGTEATEVTRGIGPERGPPNTKITMGGSPGIFDAIERSSGIFDARRDGPPSIIDFCGVCGLRVETILTAQNFKSKLLALLEQNPKFRITNQTEDACCFMIETDDPEGIADPITMNLLVLSVRRREGLLIDIRRVKGDGFAFLRVFFSLKKVMSVANFTV